jgi:predicted phage terminase large subunit-like protein
LVLKARAELERRKRRRRTEPLLDFVHDITPRWEPPHHLKAICDLFERAETEEVRALVSVPPQHGKTETILHGAAQLLLRHPHKTVGYVSYAADFAHSKSRLARDYALKAGVELRSDSQSVSEWRTMQNGGFLATGVGGPFTGHGIQLLIIDDPHKNRVEADSPVMRAHVRGWATSTAFSRVHPGSSIIIVHTRWHEDDLIGSLSKEKRRDGSPAWEVVNLPAVGEDGTPLWPSQRPLSFIERQEDTLGPFDFSALYMGAPRPRGDALFKDVHFYEALPGSYRVGIGLDLAYSAKTHSDYSVAWVMAESGGVYYVLDVKRAQAPIREFAKTLRQLKTTYPHARMRWLTGGNELQLAEYLGNEEGLAIEAVAAKGDKFTRAQPLSTDWNQGRVLLPHTVRRDATGTILSTASPTWVAPLVEELGTFTGVHDRHDDQVDAAVAARTILGEATAPAPPVDALITSNFDEATFGM